MTEPGVPPAPAGDALLRQMETLWEQGHNPDPDALLREAGITAPREVAEVLAADQWRRWHAGEGVPAEEYLARHPQVAAEPEAALLLIYGEFLVREERGEAPSPAEYLARFPHLAGRLSRQLNFHDALEAAPTFSDSMEKTVPPQPTAVPGYEILGELGRGGMGVVYKARQVRLNRVVALKMILAGGHAGCEERIRFLAEAEVIAAIKHPGIVQVYDFGTHEGLPFFALEFCDGGPLSVKLAAGPLPHGEAARLVEQVARAVQALHERGIIHRDLKPGNILLGHDGQPRVTDFGLARRVEGSGLTQTGVVMGTPSYLAPEQAQGKEVGQPVDIYALGAVLYECLTGRPPFLADSALDTLFQTVNAEPAHPRRLNPKVPRDLETICLKCLHKTPVRRYPSAGELADELARWQRGEPIRARPAGVVEHVWRWSQRNPAWAAMLGSVAVLLLIIAVGASGGVLRLRAALAESDRNLERARQAEQATQEQLFDAEVAQARSNSLSHHPGERFASLAVLSRAAEQAHRLSLSPERLLELRNATILALAVPDLHVGPTWAGFPEGSLGVDFNEDLTVYARLDVRGNCEVRRVADDQLLQRLESPSASGNAGGPFLSPDGLFLAWVVGSRSAHYRRNGDTWVLQFHEQGFTWVDYHPDGRHAAVAHSDGSISLYDLQAGQLVRRLPAGVPKPETVVALHPSEPLVAVVSYQTRALEIRDLNTGAVLRSLEVPTGGYRVAWHPLGHTLAVSEGDGHDIRLYDRATFRPIRRLAGAGPGSHIAFNRTGDLLAAFPWGADLKLYDTVTGRMLFHNPSHQVPMPFPRFSRDGLRLACGVQGEQLSLWEVDAAREYRTLVHQGEGNPGTYDFVAVGPDNRLLAVLMNGTIRFWDLGTGHEVGSLPASVKDVFVLAGTPPDLVACSPISGLQRWPIRAREEPPATLLRIGPPQRLAPTVSYHLDASRDGGVLVACARNASIYIPYLGGWVFHSGRYGSPLRLDQGKDLWEIAVSPDGCWVATAQRGMQKPTKVWNARDGLLVKELAGGDGVYPRFSPDGRWLAVSGDLGRLHPVGTWEPGLRFRGRAQFSPDSRVLAVSEAGVIRLLEVATGNELARLEDPNQEVDSWHQFTPDGTRLVTLSNGKEGGIHVWNLLAIRHRLRKMGLDWDELPLPASPVVSKRALRIAVDQGALASFSEPPNETAQQKVERLGLILRADPDDVEAYHFRGHAYESLGKFGHAISDFTEALKRQPDDTHFLAARGRDRFALRQYEAGMADLERSLALKQDQADLCDLLARLRVRGPQALRDPKTALALANRAVKLAPEQLAFRGTLGLALYHNDRPGEAVAALEKSLEGDRGVTSALHLFYLAMCHRRLGDPGSAKECFNRALEWRQKQKSLPANLDRVFREYQADAEKVLGIAPK